MTLPPLSATHLNGRPRPQPRILQFGGGNFLRGFMDWKIDRLNEASGSDWGVMILRSLGSTDGSALNAQEGLYTVVSRGIGEDGAAQSHSRLVASVLGELSCDGDWDRVLGLARTPMIEVVVSNTTEAGIAYVAGQTATDSPPASFPAKLTRLLVERYHALGHLPGMGWQVLPCELTENSGDRLRDLVLRHADEWAVGAACLDWIERETVFYNTLVDRIVTGHPGQQAAAELETALGYRDPCLTTAELFHLL
ncbi:MAG: altronate oxidoreductase, partial [Pseudomonadota bacterium]